MKTFAQACRWQAFQQCPAESPSSGNRHPFRPIDVALRDAMEKYAARRRVSPRWPFRNGDLLRLLVPIAVGTRSGIPRFIRFESVFLVWPIS